jgi:hypothetical protein
MQSTVKRDRWAVYDEITTITNISDERDCFIVKLRKENM